MDYLGTESSDSIDQLQLNLPDWVNLYGLGGDDIIHIYTSNAIGGPGNDVLIGHYPWSSAVYWGSPNGVVIDLTLNEVQDGYGTVDKIQSINNFQGSGNGDIFIGNADDNVFWPSSTYDQMDGGGGIDQAIISTSNPNIDPEFTKIENGWSVRYEDEFGHSKHLELVSVEIFSIWSGGEGYIDWDISGGTPYLIPDAATIFQPVPYVYDREQWKITNWAIEQLDFTEDVGMWCYPTPDNCGLFGNLQPDAHNAAVGDFNGDGYQDIIISWMVFPHTIPHETQPLPTLLLGSADGLVKAEDGAVPNSAPRHMLYRTLTANLNGDGIDDFVVGAMHYPVYGDSNQDEIIWQSAPTLAVLGSSNNELTDISGYLEGQTLIEGNTRGTSDHATAIGDLNNDGIDDIFSGETFWVSDGSGQWLDMTDRISEALTVFTTNVECDWGPQ